MATGANKTIFRRFVDEVMKQGRHCAWLEVKTEDPEAFREKVLAAGLPRVEYLTGGFYFPAPGGQVWGILSTQEAGSGGLENMDKKRG